MRLHLLVSLLSVTALSACFGAIDDEPAIVEVGIGSTSSALQADEGSVESARHLRLHVSEIRVHVAGGDGWATVFSGNRVVTLSANSPVQEILGSANAHAGRITQVRLLLASAPELVEGATTTELECGSCAESGLKIIPAGTLALEAGERRHVTIAFDVDRSIVDANGTLRLKPVMRLDEH